MIKTVLASIIAVAVSQASFAAETGPYVQFGLGVSSLKEDALEDNNGAKIGYSTDSGISGSAGLGYKISNGFRIDGEYTYRDNEIKAMGIKGNIESHSLMANGYVDIPTGGKITPYIGAGAGVSNVSDGDVDDTVFAYQGMAGLSYAVSEQTAIQLGYKYFATSTPKYDVGFGKVKAPYRTHNLELGVRYSF